MCGVTNSTTTTKMNMGKIQITGPITNKIVIEVEVVAIIITEIMIMNLLLMPIKTPITPFKVEDEVRIDEIMIGSKMQITKQKSKILPIKIILISMTKNLALIISNITIKTITNRETEATKDNAVVAVVATVTTMSVISQIEIVSTRPKIHLKKQMIIMMITMPKTSPHSNIMKIIIMKIVEQITVEVEDVVAPTIKEAAIITKKI